MSGTLLFKYNTSTALDAYTGFGREITVDTTYWRPRLMDGVTVGGLKLAMQSDLGPVGNVHLNNVSTLAISLFGFNGGGLNINNTIVQVPSSGVTVSATGKTVDTTHYIYAFMSSLSTLPQLDPSTIGTTTLTNGMRVKTGSSDRTLVGMARVVTGPAWSSSPLLTLSYFNRHLVADKSFQTSSDITLSTVATYAEWSTQNRVPFLTWGDEGVQINASGLVSGNSSGTNVRVAMGFDGVTAEDGWFSYSAPAGLNPGSASIGLTKTGLSEGYHDARLLGGIDSTAFTAHFFGGSTQGQRWANYVSVNG